MANESFLSFVSGAQNAHSANPYGEGVTIPTLNTAKPEDAAEEVVQDDPYSAANARTKETLGRLAAKPMGRGSNPMELEMVPEDADPNTPITEARVFGQPMKAEKLAASENGKKLLGIMAANRKGRMGLAEGFTPGADMIPFVGDYAGAGMAVSEMLKVKKTFEKVNKGEKVTDDELITARLYIADTERKGQATLAGKLGQGMRTLPSLAIEMAAYGAAYATGVGSLGATPALMAKFATKAETSVIKNTAKKLAKELVEKGMREAGEKISKEAVDQGIKKLGTEALSDITDKAATKLGRGTLSKELTDEVVTGLEEKGLQSASTSKMLFDVNSYYLKRGLLGGARGGEGFDGVAGRTIAGRALDTVGLLAVTPAAAAVPYTLLDEVVDAGISSRIFDGTGNIGDSRQKVALDIQGEITENQNLKDNSRWYALGLKAVEFGSETSGQGFSMFGKTLGQIADAADHYAARKMGKIAGDAIGDDAKLRAASRAWKEDVNRGLSWKFGQPGEYKRAVEDIRKVLTTDPDPADAMAVAKRAYYDSRVRGTLGWWAAEKMAKRNIDPATMHKYMAKMGQDGWLEEIMEERWGGFVQGFWGLNDGSQNMGFKAAMDAAWPQMDQLASEAILFAIPGATVSAMDHAYGSYAYGSLADVGKKLDKVQESVKAKDGTKANREAGGLDLAIVNELDKTREPQLGLYGEQVYNNRQTVDALTDVMMLGAKTKKGPDGFLGRVLDYGTRVVQTVATGHIGFMLNQRDSYANALQERGMGAQSLNFGRAIYNAQLSKLGEDKEFLGTRTLSEIPAAELDAKIRPVMADAAAQFIDAYNMEEGKIVISEDLVNQVRERAVERSTNERKLAGLGPIADGIPDSIIVEELKNMLDTGSVFAESTGIGQNTAFYLAATGDAIETPATDRSEAEQQHVATRVALNTVLAKKRLTGIVELTRDSDLAMLMPRISASLNNIDLTEATMRKIADGSASEEDQAAANSVLAEVGILPLDTKNVDVNGKAKRSNGALRLREYMKHILALKDSGYLGNHVTGRLLYPNNGNPRQEEITIAFERQNDGTFKVSHGIGDETQRLMKAGVFNLDDESFPTLEAARVALTRKLRREDNTDTHPEFSLVEPELTLGAGGFRFLHKYVISSEDPVKMIEALRGTYMLGLGSTEGFDADSIQQYLSAVANGQGEEQWARDRRDAAAKLLATNRFVDQVSLRGKTRWLMTPGGSNDRHGNTYLTMDHRMSSRDLTEEIWEKLYKSYGIKNPAFRARNPVVVDAMMLVVRRELEKIIQDKNSPKHLREEAEYAAEHIFTTESGGRNIEGFSKLCVDIFCGFADYAKEPGVLDRAPLSGLLAKIGQAVRDSKPAPAFVGFMVGLANVGMIDNKNPLAPANFGRLFLPPNSTDSSTIRDLNAMYMQFEDSVKSARAFYAEELAKIPGLTDEQRDVSRVDPYFLSTMFENGATLVDVIRASKIPILDPNNRGASEGAVNNSLLSLPDLCTKHPDAVRMMYDFYIRFDGLKVSGPDDLSAILKFSKFLGTGDDVINSIDTVTIAKALKFSDAALKALKAIDAGENIDAPVSEDGGGDDAFEGFDDLSKRRAIDKSPLLNVLMRIIGAPRLGADNLARSGFGDLVKHFLDAGRRDEAAVMATIGARGSYPGQYATIDLKHSDGIVVLNAEEVEKAKDKDGVLPSNIVSVLHPWSLATLVSATSKANPANAVAWNTEASFKTWCMTASEYQDSRNEEQKRLDDTDPEAAKKFLAETNAMVAVKRIMFEAATSEALRLLFQTAGYSNAKEILSEMFGIVPGMGAKITNTGAVIDEESPQDQTTAESKDSIRAIMRVEVPSLHDCIVNSARNTLVNNPQLFRSFASPVAVGGSVYAASAAEAATGKLGGELSKYVRLETVVSEDGKARFKLVPTSPKWSTQLINDLQQHGWLGANVSATDTAQQAGLAKAIRIFDSIMGIGNQFSDRLRSGYPISSGDATKNAQNVSVLANSISALVQYAVAMHNRYVDLPEELQGKTTAQLDVIMAEESAKALDSLPESALFEIGSSSPSLGEDLIALSRRGAVLPSLGGAEEKIMNPEDRIEDPVVRKAVKDYLTKFTPTNSAAENLRLRRGMFSEANMPTPGTEDYARASEALDLTIASLRDPYSDAADRAREAVFSKRDAEAALLTQTQKNPKNAAPIEQLMRILFGSKLASRYRTPNTSSTVNLYRRRSPIEDTMLEDSLWDEVIDPKDGETGKPVSGAGATRLRELRLSGALDGMPIIAEVSGISHRVPSVGKKDEDLKKDFIKNIDYNDMQPQEYDDVLFGAFADPSRRLKPNVMSFRVFAGDKSTTWIANLPVSMVVSIMNRSKKEGAKDVSVADFMGKSDSSARGLYDAANKAVDKFVNGGYASAGFKRQRTKNSEGKRPMIGFKDGMRGTTEISVIMDFTGIGGNPSEILWGEMLAGVDHMRRLNVSLGKAPNHAVTQKFHIIDNTVSDPLGNRVLTHLKGNTQAKDPESIEAMYKTLAESPIPSDRAMGRALKAFFGGGDVVPDLVTDGDSLKESWMSDIRLKSKDVKVAAVLVTEEPGEDGKMVEVLTPVSKRLQNKNVELNRTEQFKDIRVWVLDADSTPSQVKGHYESLAPAGMRGKPLTLADAFPGLHGTRIVEVATEEKNEDGTAKKDKYVLLDISVPTQSIFQASHLTHDTKLHPIAMPLPAKYDFSAYGEAGREYYLDVSGVEEYTSNLAVALGMDKLSRLDVVAALGRNAKEAQVFMAEATTEEAVLRATWLSEVIGPQRASQVRESARVSRTGTHSQVFSSYTRFFKNARKALGDEGDGDIVNLFNAENTAVHESYLVDVGGELKTKFALARINVDATQKHVRRGMYLKPDATTTAITEELMAAEAAGDAEMVAKLTVALADAQKKQIDTLCEGLEFLHDQLALVGQDKTNPNQAVLLSAWRAKAEVLSMLTDEFGEDATEGEGETFKSRVNFEVSFDDLFARDGKIDRTAFYVTGESIPGHSEILTHPGRGYEKTKYLAALGGTLFTRDRNPGASLSAHGAVRLFYAADYALAPAIELTTGFGVSPRDKAVVRKTDKMKNVLVPGKGNKVIFSPITQEIIGNDNDGDTDFLTTFSFDRFGRVVTPTARASKARVAASAEAISMYRDAKVREFMKETLDDGSENTSRDKYGRFGDDGQVEWTDFLQRENYRRLTQELIDEATSQYSNQIIVKQLSILDSTVRRDPSGKSLGQEAGWLRGYDAYMPINTDPIATPERCHTKAEYIFFADKAKGEGLDSIRDILRTPAFSGYELLAYMSQDEKGVAQYEWVPLRLHPEAKDRMSAAGFTKAEIESIEKEHTFFGLMGLSKMTNPVTTEDFVTASNLSHIGASSRGTIVTGIRDTIFALRVFRGELNLARGDEAMLHDFYGNGIKYPGSSARNFATLSRNTSDESLGLTLEWTKDLVNLIIDDPKDAKALPMGLYPEFISLYTVLLAGTEFESRDDIRKFHAEFVAWTQTPIARIYLEENTRNKYMADIRVPEYALNESGNAAVTGSVDRASATRLRTRVAVASLIGSPLLSKKLAGYKEYKDKILTLSDWYGKEASAYHAYEGKPGEPLEFVQRYIDRMMLAITRADGDEGKLVEVLNASRETISEEFKTAALNALKEYNNIRRISTMSFGLNEVSKVAFATQYKRSTTPHGAARLAAVNKRVSKEYVAANPSKEAAIRANPEIPIMIPALGRDGSPNLEAITSALGVSEEMATRFMRAYEGSIETSNQMKWLALNVLAQRDDDTVSEASDISAILDKFSKSEFERMVTMLKAMVHQQAGFQSISPTLYAKLQRVKPIKDEARNVGIAQAIPGMMNYWLPVINTVMHAAITQALKNENLKGNTWVSALQVPVSAGESLFSLDESLANAIQLRYRMSDIMPEILKRFHNDAELFMGSGAVYHVTSAKAGDTEPVDFSGSDIMNLLWLYGVTVYGPEVTRGQSGSFMGLIPPSVQAPRWDIVNAFLSHGKGTSVIPTGVAEAGQVPVFPYAEARYGESMHKTSLDRLVSSDAGWKGKIRKRGYENVLDIPKHFPMSEGMIGAEVRYTGGALAGRMSSAKRFVRRSADEVMKSAEVANALAFGEDIARKAIPVDRISVPVKNADGTESRESMTLPAAIRHILSRIPTLSDYFAPIRDIEKASGYQLAVDHLFREALGSEISKARDKATKARRFSKAAAAANEVTVPGSVYPSLLLALREMFLGSFRHQEQVDVINHLLGLPAIGPDSLLASQNSEYKRMAEEFLNTRILPHPAVQKVMKESGENQVPTIMTSLAYMREQLAFSDTPIHGEGAYADRVSEEKAVAFMQSMGSLLPALGDWASASADGEKEENFSLSTLDIQNYMDPEDKVDGTISKTTNKNYPPRYNPEGLISGNLAFEPGLSFSLQSAITALDDEFRMSLKAILSTENIIGLKDPDTFARCRGALLDTFLAWGEEYSGGNSPYSTRVTQILKEVTDGKEKETLLIELQKRADNAYSLAGLVENPDVDGPAFVLAAMGKEFETWMTVKEEPQVPEAAAPSVPGQAAAGPVSPAEIPQSSETDKQFQASLNAIKRIQEVIDRPAGKGLDPAFQMKHSAEYYNLGVKLRDALDSTREKDYRGEYIRYAAQVLEDLDMQVRVMYHNSNDEGVAARREMEQVFMPLKAAILDAIAVTDKAAYTRALWGDSRPRLLRSTGVVGSERRNSEDKLKPHHQYSYTHLKATNAWQRTQPLRRVVNEQRVEMGSLLKTIFDKYIAGIPEMGALADTYRAAYAQNNTPPAKTNDHANRFQEKTDHFDLVTTHSFRSTVRSTLQKAAEILHSRPGDAYAQTLADRAINLLELEELDDNKLGEYFESMNHRGNGNSRMRMSHDDDVKKDIGIPVGAVSREIAYSESEAKVIASGFALPPETSMDFSEILGGHEGMCYEPRMVFSDFRTLYAGLVSPITAIRGKRALYDAQAMPGFARVKSDILWELKRDRQFLGLSNSDGAIDKVIKRTGKRNVSFSGEAGAEGGISAGGDDVTYYRIERHIAALDAIDSRLGTKLASDGFMTDEDISFMHLVGHSANLLSNEYTDIDPKKMAWSDSTADLLASIREAAEGSKFEVDMRTPAGDPIRVTVSVIRKEADAVVLDIHPEGSFQVAETVANDATSLGAWAPARWRREYSKRPGERPAVLTDIKLDLSQARDDENSAYRVTVARLLAMSLPAAIRDTLLAELEAAATSAEVNPGTRAKTFLATLERRGFAIIPEDGNGEPKLTIPISLVESAFDSSSTKAKLLAANREPEMLSMWHMAAKYQSYFKRLREAARNAYGLSLGEDARFLYSRGSSGVLFSGSGFFPYIARKAEDRIGENLGKVTAERMAKYKVVMDSTDPATDSIDDVSMNMFRYLFDLYGESRLLIRNGTEMGASELRSAIASGDFAVRVSERGLRIPATATKATIATMIHDKCMETLVKRAMNLRGDVPEKADFDVEALLKAVQTSHIAETTLGDPDRSAFDGTISTFAEAYKKLGMLPANLSGIDAVEKYAKELARDASTRYTLMNMLVSEEEDGTPLIFANPDLAFNGQGLIPDSTWELAARKWAAFFNTGYDSALTPKQNAKNIIDKFVAPAADNTILYRSVLTPVKGALVTSVNSPWSLKSITKFYALKDKRGESVSTLATYLNGGEAAGMLKHALNLPTLGTTNAAMRFLLRMNNILKLNAMAMSVFFPIATWEGMMAVGGPRALFSTKRSKNSAFASEIAGLSGDMVSKLPGFSSVNGDDAREMLKSQFTLLEWWEMLESDHPYVRQLRGIMEEAGITWSHGDNNPYALKLSDMKSFLGTFEKNAARLVGRKAAMNMKQMWEAVSTEQSEFVFDYMTNTAKLMAAHTMLQKASAEAKREGRTINALYELKQHANYINSEVGGLNVNQYAWATPQVREWLNLFMFSWNWTLGAWESAGMQDLTRHFFGHKMMKQEREFIWKRRWPMMAALVMVMEPMIMQAASAITYKLFSDDPDEAKKKAKMWMWQNEAGKKFSANITPLLKTFGSYSGGSTKGRQIYARAGKQAWEIMGWFENPRGNLGGKTSIPFHMAYELFSGRTMGVEWDLGFKNQGAVGGFFSGERGFEDSTLMYLGSKAVPFSVSGFIRYSDEGMLPAFISATFPTSRGINLKDATSRTKELLRGWADNDNYSRLYEDGKLRAHLYDIARDTLNAAKENGYDPKKILSDAQRELLTEQYADFGLQIPGPGESISRSQAIKLEQISRNILRLNGTALRLKASMETKNKFQNRKYKGLDRVQKAALMTAFADPKHIPASFTSKHGFIEERINEQLKRHSDLQKLWKEQKEASMEGGLDDDAFEALMSKGKGEKW